MGLPTSTVAMPSRIAVIGPIVEPHAMLLRCEYTCHGTSRALARGDELRRRCRVNRWSRFDNDWQGVAFQEVLKLVKLKPEAKYVLVHAEQGFTANVPLIDLDREDVLFATHHDGQPLTADHGFPLRLIVPHLYAWKSVKWVRGLEFTEHDVPGFWEQNGYHMYGDPFLEQRFDTD